MHGEIPVPFVLVHVRGEFPQIPLELSHRLAVQTVDGDISKVVNEDLLAGPYILDGLLAVPSTFGFAFLKENVPDLIQGQVLIDSCSGVSTAVTTGCSG